MKAAKTVADESFPNFKEFKSSKLEIETTLDLKDGGLCNMRFILTAGRSSDPETFRAVFLLDERRIRGVGFKYTESKEWYKISIHKGWNENIIDPNKPLEKQNHHAPLENFNPTDLVDFLDYVAKLWNIELPVEGRLL